MLDKTHQWSQIRKESFLVKRLQGACHRDEGIGPICMVCTVSQAKSLWSWQWRCDTPTLSDVFLIRWMKATDVVSYNTFGKELDLRRCVVNSSSISQLIIYLIVWRHSILLPELLSTGIFQSISNAWSKYTLTSYVVNKNVTTNSFNTITKLCCLQGMRHVQLFPIMTNTQSYHRRHHCNLSFPQYSIPERVLIGCCGSHHPKRCLLFSFYKDYKRKLIAEVWCTKLYVS